MSKMMTNHNSDIFVVPSQDNKILEFDKYLKCDNMPCIILVVVESLIKKMDRYKKKILKNHPQWKWKNIFPMSAIWTIDGTEAKIPWQFFFFESLRKHVIKIINFEKNKMIPLTNEQQEPHEKAKIC